MAEEIYDVISTNVRIFGRTLDIAGARWLGYSGSGIEFQTRARKVQVDILGISETNDLSDFAWIGVFLDGSDVMAKRFQVRRDLRTYEVLYNPEGASHTVKLVKLTETRNDKVALSCIRADEPLYPAGAREHSILFIGDSLTAGYGIAEGHMLSEDPAQYQFTTAEEDVTKGYAWQSARMLDASAQFFCWSGNGVISQYVEPSSEVPVTDNLMPSLLPYTDKITEQVARIYLKAHGWKEKPGAPALTYLGQQGDDFRPELVVSNLGTNDASFTRNVRVRERHFVQRYLEMLREVQRIYPGARILITYGMMETSLSDACNETALLGDYQYLQLPLMNPLQDGIGGGGHPSTATHRLTAEILTARIRDMMGWPRTETAGAAEDFFDE